MKEVVQRWREGREASGEVEALSRSRTERRGIACYFFG
jgi:hypothetical protein